MPRSASPVEAESTLFAADPALEGKRLVLMRHGKTYEPRLDTPMVAPEQDRDLPLTRDGRTQVRETAKLLEDAKFDTVFSSTFSRSVETAGIVAAPHDLEVATRSEFEELRVYPKAGGDMRDTARRYIEVMKQLERFAPHDVVLDQGETVGSVIEGALHALRECLAGPGRRVLVVAHGGLNRLLLTRFLGIPLCRFLSIDQDFACVNVIEFVRRGRPWVRVLNATAYDPFKGEDIRP